MKAENRPTVRGKLIRASIAAEMLGIDSHTLRTWCRRVDPPIPYRLMEGNYLFDTADLEDYLATTYVAAGK